MTAIASKAQLRMSLLRYALVTVPLVLLLGTISGRIAQAGDGNAWFERLAKPDFMPPGWVFGVAWTILYVLLGLALAMLLHARGARWRGAAIALFVVQLALNYAWPPLFFAFHQVGGALWLIGTRCAETSANGDFSDPSPCRPCGWSGRAEATRSLSPMDRRMKALRNSISG